MPYWLSVLMGGCKCLLMILFDMIMIKHNPSAASGSIGAAVRNAHAYLQANAMGDVKIEVETRTMDEVAVVIALLDDEAVDTSAVSRVMLDNMSLEDMAEAVRMFGGRVETEASGHVTLETVHAIGQTGVTFISSRAPTPAVAALGLARHVETRS